MAATKTSIVKNRVAMIAVLDVTFDASYPAGGYAINPGPDCDFSRILHAFPGKAVDGAGNVLLAAFDETANKLRLYYPTGGGQASPAAVAAPAAGVPGVGTFTVTTTPDAGATGLTGSVAKPALVGVLSGALAAPTLTPGAGKEVANATDVSGFTTRLTVLGY